MKGLLVNYEICTGCHSCEVACKKHLDLKEGEFGIKLCELGPYEYEDAEPYVGKERWDWAWIPVLTKKCDMCEDRVAVGKNALMRSALPGMVPLIWRSGRPRQRD